MEPLFVCEFKPTVKMVANRVTHYSLVRWIIMMVILCGCAVYLLPPAIIMLSYQFDLTWAVFLLLGLLYIVLGVFFPQINAFFAVRRFKKDTDGEGVYRISFGDVIEVKNGNIRTIWEYDEITQVVRLKYTYELKKNKRMAVFVDPNGFTKGTFEEFKQFLRAKRPDLTIPE